MADQPDKIAQHPGFYGAAYACLYKSLGQTVDQYPGKDITVSLFREAYPRELFTALRSSGRSIEEKFPERSGDAYEFEAENAAQAAQIRRRERAKRKSFCRSLYITGDVMFDTQVVVTSRLEADSHSPLRILSGNAGKEDVKRFLQEISNLKTPGDRNNADAVLQVSI